MGGKGNTPEELLQTILEHKRTGAGFENFGIEVVGRALTFPVVQIWTRYWTGSSDWSREPIFDIEENFEAWLNHLARFDDYRIHRAARILVDGREAYLADVEKGGVNGIRYVRINVPDGDIVWDLECTMATRPVDEWT